jgi:class 3 adenylate cyclase/tetratricopeptide (TPR) repeat protein
MDDQFCRHCGARLSGSPGEARYRHVTVLCTDLSGYSSLAELLDPEDLRTCMDRIMGEVTRIIHRYGGTVEKYIGDAVVALFGGRITCEDDPVRAILAARAVHRAVEEAEKPLPGRDVLALRMHSGISTGEVIVDFRQVAESPHGALGRPINTASRLCDMAGAGEIFIGESLVTDAMRHFHLEWMGRKVLKGFRNPIHVYRVMGERAVPVGVHRQGGVTSPLVGRDHELSVLMAKKGDLLRGRGGVLSVVGDAGVGKSRLVEEFRAASSQETAFFCTFCYDHTRTTPYAPLFPLVTEVLGVTEPGRSGGCIAGRSQAYGVHPRHAGFLAGFVERAWTDQGPSVQGGVKESISDAVLSLLEAVARTRPSVFCMEDIHWADQSTLDLLGYLAHAWEARCPCLLLVTHRQDMDRALPGTCMRIRELGDDDIGRMIKLMLKADTLPDALLGFLARATGGNPFYLEEVVNFLLEQGVDPCSYGRDSVLKDVPVTLYGLVSSRLDHLGPDARGMLQVASLMGRTFSVDLLSHFCGGPGVLDAAVQSALRHGFIQPAGGAQFAFRHEITRDVAARTLLKGERSMLHRKIAFTMEETLGPRAPEHAEELARHFRQAGEDERAIHYCMEAARRALASGAWVEAAGHYREAEQLLLLATDVPGSDERLMAAREGIWMCSRVFNPTLATGALEAVALQYRAAGRDRDDAFCSVRLINLYSQRGLFDRAVHAYEEALSLCRDDAVLVAAARTALAYTHTYLGRPLVALELLDEARPVLAAADPFLHAVNLLTALAASVWRTDLAGAHAFYGRLKQLSAAYLDIDLMADIWLAHICCLEGGFRKARSVYREIVDRERKLGRLSGGLTYLRIQGSIYFRCRYFKDLAGARSDLELFDDLGSQIAGADSLKGLYRAWIALEEGNARAAHELILSALPGLRRGIANRVPYALNALAEANLMRGDPDAAGRAARECIEWNERSGNMDQLVWALRNSAEADILRGDLAGANRSLARAHALARTMGMKPHLAGTLAAWGRLLARAGRPDKAALCLERSRQLWKEMGLAAMARKLNLERERLLNP